MDGRNRSAAPAGGLPDQAPTAAPRPTAGGRSAPGSGAEPSTSADAPRPFSLAPSITLPKGGGALQGVDEKHAVSAATGAATASIGLPVSPSRNGFQPALGLSYDSGGGNGPFGLGWTLALPTIQRRTAKGLPRYRDADDSDTFVISEAEDLVPLLERDGDRWVRHAADRDGFRVERYRPRVEGAFSRIERWTRLTDGDVHWRVLTRDDVTHWFGRSPASRIADPTDPRRIFSWLLEESRNDRGDIIVYEYKAEDGVGVDFAATEESNRLRTAFPQRYLKRVRYGNRAMGVPADWMFEVVLDYGEHPIEATPVEDQAWPARSDPFSSGRAGFELRTWRLCRRVLLFHRFPKELGPDPYLVRSTVFDHALRPQGAQLTSVTQLGHIRENGTWRTASLPPVSYSYTTGEPDPGESAWGSADLPELPGGFDPARHQWIDLDGEGIPGLFTEVEGAWYYARNLGSGRLAPWQAVDPRPSLANLHGGAQQLTDLDGDGRLELLVLGLGLTGTYSRTDQGWEPMRALESQPVLDWQDPNLRWVDLDGDGRADLLYTGDEALLFYPSRGKDGFGPSEAIRKALNEAEGPVLVFADGTQTVMLADLDGDGLVDLVRVRNGEVCYWPNLGHGHFGRRVTMGGSPLFDTPDAFDPRRLRFVDADGTGPTDLLYLGSEGPRLWHNQSGNRWVEATLPAGAPPTDELDAVQVVDLFGDGTGCLVWASALPDRVNPVLRWMRLCGGKKPNLLERIENHMGAHTTYQYTPSTRYYLEDQAAGAPWKTRIPFPVQVVARVEAVDEVADTKLVSRYRYRDGYFDGVEREFRGFGCVDQEDAEALGPIHPFGEAVRELDEPPVRIRTWFHTGAWLGDGRVSRLFADQYWAGDPDAFALPDTPLPTGLDPTEEREACRALRGRPLRVETYALDGSAAAGNPYTVAETRYGVRRLQPRDGERNAVFLVHDGEQASWTYERNPADPRVAWTGTLRVDDYGTPLRVAAVALPRRVPAHPEQAGALVTVAESRVVHRDEDPDRLRLGLGLEQVSYELTGKSFDPRALPDMEELDDAIETAERISYEARPATDRVQLRRVQRARTVYARDDAPEEPASDPTQDPCFLGLVWQQYGEAFTPEHLGSVYGEKLNGIDLRDGGYVLLEGTWWSPSGRAQVDPARFFLPVAATDPFGNRYEADLDEHSLLTLRTRAPAPILNEVVATPDYRVLQPATVVDPNGNRATVAFDALGLVTRTWVAGKDGDQDGDRDPEQPTTWFNYHLDEWSQGRPNLVHVIAREEHGPTDRFQHRFAYFDGSGRVLQEKVQAAPGPAPDSARPPRTWTATDGSAVPQPAATRWVGSGRVVLNNKGKPVKQYEPFFSRTPAFESEPELVERGVTSVLHYDAAGRLVRTDLPDGTFLKVVFTPWLQEDWDASDTVADSAWLRGRAGTLEAEASLLHGETPTVTHFDTLGRPFLAVADNGPRGKGETRTELDIEGNPLLILDARGNHVMKTDYAVGGQRLQWVSMDAGARWELPACDGRPMRAWDQRGHVHRPMYDELRRPTGLCVRGASVGAQEILVRRTFWGDRPGVAGAEERNLRGRVFRKLDEAGLVTIDRYDFKGNVLAGSRRLARQWDATPDWAVSAAGADLDPRSEPLLETELFTDSGEYDALNRQTRFVGADGTAQARRFDEGGALCGVEVAIPGQTAVPLVQEVEYNARGQRERIAYGNGATTTYTWDPQTFRLLTLTTRRLRDNVALQDLGYRYDAAGNILEISDDAKQTVYFENQRMDARWSYTYDALHRLIRATGREHIGQNPNAPDDPRNPFRGSIPHPNDGQALRNYVEEYDYDHVGNILEMRHRAGGAGWTRGYQYADDSNRLLASGTDGLQTFESDDHGSFVKMPSIPALAWDHRDHLARTTNDGQIATSYTYDDRAERVRKVSGRRNGLWQERIYVDYFEVYREWDRDKLLNERTTAHAMDGGRRLVMVETRTVREEAAVVVQDPVWRYQLGNHLETVAAELDDEAMPISYEEFHPYGTTAWYADSGRGVVSLKRYRYTGKERDEETGLSYHSARYYAPFVGRWICTDPSGLRGGLNLFCYCMAAPSVGHDPSGRQMRSDLSDDRREIARRHQHETTRNVVSFSALSGGFLEAIFSATPPGMMFTFGQAAYEYGEAMASGDYDRAQMVAFGMVPILGPIIVSTDAWQQAEALEDEDARREAKSRIIGNVLGLISVGVVSEFALSSVVAEGTYNGGRRGVSAPIEIPEGATRKPAESANPNATRHTSVSRTNVYDPTTRRVQSTPAPQQSPLNEVGQPVNSYRQIQYTWTENGVDYTARLHGRTPNAPQSTPINWRITASKGGTTFELVRLQDGTTRWLPASLLAQVRANPSAFSSEMQYAAGEGSHIRALPSSTPQPPPVPIVPVLPHDDPNRDRR